MNSAESAQTEQDAPSCRVARFASLIVSGAFLLILFLALTNEDKPQGRANVILALLALSIVACIAAWRWQRVGGMAAIAGGLALGIAAYSATVALGPGFSGLLGALIYGVPFLLVGILFLQCGRSTATGATA